MNIKASKWVGGGVVGGWVVERFMVWVVVRLVVGGFMGWVHGGMDGGGVCGGVHGWRVNGVGAYTHPLMNSYNVKIFNFMNTHPPIKCIQSVTLLLYIYSCTHEQL